MLYATRTEVNQDALRSNLVALRGLIGQRKLLVSVKANAYGHGAVVVAKQIQAEHLADWLGVATTPEALTLREAGITLPILRFSQAFPEEIETLIDHNVALTVQDEQTIDQVADQAAGKPHPVHLAIDTGMHRIGCQPQEAPQIARYAVARGLNLQGIFTHLPVADTNSGRAFTENQLAKFHRAVEQVQSDRKADGLSPVELIHAANSAATIAYPLDGLTMVRPGIAAYGYYPDPETPRRIELHPVMSVKTRVSAIRKVPAGEPVGYGGTWTSDKDSWIVTVPIGYADGYDRAFSNRGRMLIGGESYPVAGRVCMDQTMLDLGSADRPCPVKTGDEVVVLGAQGDQVITADELADQLGTISYEVLVKFGMRAQQIFS